MHFSGMLCYYISGKVIRPLQFTTLFEKITLPTWNFNLPFAKQGYQYPLRVRVKIQFTGIKAKLTDKVKYWVDANWLAEP